MPSAAVLGYYAGWSTSVGSRRVRGLARGLTAAGWDVTVIGARPPSGGSTAPPAGVRLLETRTADRVLAARAVAGRVRRGSSATARGPAAPPAAPSATGASRAGRSARVARGLVGFPDTMWEWTYAAQRAGRRSGLRPDVVVASAPPVAALHAASRLADHWACPWVADLRDLWSGDPHRTVPSALQPLDRRLERRVLRSAAAFTTVARPLADELEAIAPGTPTAVIRNGFDPSWLRSGDDPPTTPARVVYTGTLTTNTGRDVSTVVAVARQLADTAPGTTLEFYGATSGDVRAALSAPELAGTVVLRGVVPADVVRDAQHRATMLLSISWDDPRDVIACPAKLFEYAAARRPILHLGRDGTEGTRLIVDHGLGFVRPPTDPAAIAALVADVTQGRTDWCAPSIDDLAPLSQDAMAAAFLNVLEQVLGRP